MAESALPVAAVITEWRQNSHADVLLRRLLEPEACGHKEPFRIRLASIYADQFPANDLCRPLCAKHGVPIFDSILGAVGVGTREVPVAGVLIIGEHGDYPHNARGQHLYPRRRLFEGVVHAFRLLGRRVPVFIDKHFSYDWLSARWMVDLARHEGVPLMAGSSLPVAWRVPDLELQRGVTLDSVLALGYGDIEAYGFHALETLQCMVERRQGGETGVRAVRCRSGPAVWEGSGSEPWPRLLEALRPFLQQTDARFQTFQPGRRDALFIVEYTDGLTAFVPMLDSARDFAFACQCASCGQPDAAVFDLQDEWPFGHFGYLLRAVEAMIARGRPVYPAERTLLTTGVLAALMQSRAESGARIPTPHLSSLTYAAADWPHARTPFGSPA